MEGDVHCYEGANVAWHESRDKCYFNFYSILDLVHMIFGAWNS